MLFNEIIGQRALKEQLIQSVKDHRISHAQLFLGNTGYGSLALAIAYGQYICCENKTEEDSCGICPSCIKYQKYIHPDLHFAFPINASKEFKNSTERLVTWREALLENPYLSFSDWVALLEAENKQPVISVEESAEILRKLTLTAFESEYKIMIIWLAEKMNAAAANKLLKILEEPPDKTLFLLVCESEEQLLRTIVSRTQLIKVKKIEDQDLCQALVSRTELSDEEAKGISELCEGNYREALKLIGENESAEYNLTTFQTWMRACLRFDILKINVLNAGFAELGRERQKNYLSYCLHMVRESLMINYADNAIVRVTEKEGEFLKKFSPFINASNCIAFSDELNRAYGHIERNANPKILFLDLSLHFNELLNIREPAIVK